MKITYSDKTNNPDAPDYQKKFSASDANEIKRVVNHNATEIISYTPIVSLDKGYVTEQLISEPINYTFSQALTPILGTKRVDYITADGINKPTFSSSFIIRYDGYLNEVNRPHRISFEYIGNGKVLVEIVYV